MENERVFDKVIYDVGDRVIRKYKGDNAKPQTVCKSVMVKNLDGFSYNVIFMEDNPDDFNVAWEFEPVDHDELIAYNEAINRVPIKKARKTSVKKTKQIKPLKFKPND